MLLLAADPGIKGAIAAYETTTGQLVVHDMPIVIRGARARKTLDVHEVHKTLEVYKDAGADYFFLEEAFGLPGQGASAAFYYGMGYGTLETAAVLLNYRIEHVPAKTWKMAMRCPADKKAALTRATELLPTHRDLWSISAKGDVAQKSGRAEASLLALYGERVLRGSRT